jgi:thiol-disulfide isomerase/thioredoxin
MSFSHKHRSASADALRSPTARALEALIALAVSTSLLQGCARTPASPTPGPVSATPEAGAVVTSETTLVETSVTGDTVTAEVPASTGEVGLAESVPTAPPGEVIDLPRKPHVLLQQPAPDFAMADVISGETVSLSGLLGKPVVVNFWATWCAPCRFEMPWFETAFKAHQDVGLTVLAVDAGEKVPPDLIADQVTRFVRSSGLTFPILLGDNTFDVQKEWTVLGLPATFLIDAEGTVVDYHSGAFPNQATFESRLAEILP